MTPRKNIKNMQKYPPKNPATANQVGFSDIAPLVNLSTFKWPQGHLAE